MAEEMLSYSPPDVQDAATMIELGKTSARNLILPHAKSAVHTRVSVRTFANIRENLR